MKIGIVCPYNIWRGGGVQECVLALHSELNSRGHTVKIITPKPKNHDTVVEDHVIVLGKLRKLHALATASDISATIDLASIKTMLDKEKFDILHFHEPWTPLIGHQILTQSNSINVATFHAKLPDTAVSKSFEKIITPYLKIIQKKIVAISAVSDAASEFVKVISPRHKITIIPNGIDLSKYQKLTNNKKSKSNKKTILFIGRIEKRKGLKYLLKAFNQITKKDKNVELQIVGSGPDKEKIEQWVKQRGIPRVKFFGYVSDSKKRDLLSKADLFCSPALYGESFGIVLLEAMAMGLVTVAGNNPGYSSVLQGTGRISLVNPKDTPMFVNKLELLLHDEGTRFSWVTWASKYVKQYDYQKVVDQYEKFYTSAVTNHKRKERL